MTLVVLALGVFIGGAFGPPSPDTLADGSDRPLIIVTGRQPPAAVRPASPDSSSPSTDFGALTGGGAAPAVASSTGATPAAVAAVATASDLGGAAEPVDNSTPAGSDLPLGGGSTGTTGAGVPPGLPAIKHVFTIVLSATGYDQLLGAHGPGYLHSELLARGEQLPNVRVVADGGLAGRIALVSGQAPTPEVRAGCPTFANREGGAGCVFPRAVKTIADQLTARGLAWRAYAQGLTTTCRHPSIGAADDTATDRPADHYAVASDPFLYFHSVIDSGDCNAGVVPVERLTEDLGSVDTTPSYTLIAPDRCHDGRAGPCADGQPAGAAAADAFLRRWIPPILASRAFRRDGLLIVTGDRGRSTGALLLSRFVTRGRTVRTRYDQYALLRSVEDLFGLDHLGHAADRTTRSFGGDVFAGSG